MQKQYNHKDHEDRIYDKWEKGGHFKPAKKDKPFTVLMPPPNANASLHAGHAMYTIDDIVIRYKRMQGYSALWQPGMDHAGFETQFVFEKELKKKGKSRLDFDRAALYKMIYDFVQENSGLIFEQFKALGFSADWSRSVFTLDSDVVSYVHDTFAKMVKDDLVYRDNYIVNYCTHCGTSLAELEVKHVVRKDTLLVVRYPLVDRKKGEDEFVEVATVRPEPIYADTHLAIHPTNKKTKWLKGRSVKNPVTGAQMEIIEDEFVDPEFGTGVVKLTPGHDPNDFAVAKKHGLPVVQAVDLVGHMIGGPYGGEKVKIAREKTIADLKDKGLINESATKNDYEHSVITCYKCGRDLEPLTIPNWFIKVADLKKKVVEAVVKDEVEFFPKRFKKQMLSWLGIMHDWPISRQIVWGIGLPVWYKVKDNPDMHVTFMDKGRAVHGKASKLLAKYSLKQILGGLQTLSAPPSAKFVVSKEEVKDALPETDTFDTWFSSGQWPLVTLPDQPKRLPTDMIGTLSDILKFWISRMILFSLYREGKIPFKDIYLWSMVADEKGTKMSKSKGNVINPIDLVEKYGADALRMSLVFGVAPGAKVILSDDKVRGMRNFANKIWNMVRFFNLMTEKYGKEIPMYDKNLKSQTKNDKEIVEKLNNLVTQVTNDLDQYRFSNAAEGIYHFLWNDVADKHIEEVKDRADKDVALSVLRHVLITSFKLLHPFMPFVTEAVWKNIPGAPAEDLISASWPTSSKG